MNYGRVRFLVSEHSDKALSAMNAESGASGFWTHSHLGSLVLALVLISRFIIGA